MPIVSGEPLVKIVPGCFSYLICGFKFLSLQMVRLTYNNKLLPVVSVFVSVFKVIFYLFFRLDIFAEGTHVQSCINNNFFMWLLRGQT